MPLTRTQLALRFLRHRLSKVHPFEVQASVTNRCNLRCAYCRCPDEDREELDTETWFELMRHLRRLGTARFKFQGGEPTLRPDFECLAARAQELGMNTAVVTNGHRIARVPKLIDVLDEIVVSLDSPTPEAHDGQRGVGNHGDAVRTIDEALARGKRPIVNMVLTQANFGQLEAMLEFCEARGIGFNAQPAIFGRVYFDSAARRAGLTPDQIRQLHVRLEGWKRDGRPVLFSTASYAHAAGWPDYDAPTSPTTQRSRCFAGRYYVHIEPDGDVVPCAMHVGVFGAKNAVRDGLEQALAHAMVHHCGDCWMPYMNERKALFAFRAGAVREVITGARSRVPGKRRRGS